MHQEKIDYYTFGNKLLAEVEAYDKLEPSGVRLPRLLAWSDEQQYLIKEYLHGPTGAELAAAGELGADHWAAILRSHQQLKAAGLHVDYFPTNFIWQNGEMVLIDYECHPYNREWDFPNWGMFYWLNCWGMKEHLETGQSDRLNLPGRPKPVWAEFLSQRDALLAQLGHPAEPAPHEVWTV